MKPRLSVIVPSYNESADLKIASINQIEQYLSNQSYSFEVLIVDDQSTNGTIDVVREAISDKPHFRLIENPHGGKAITVMTGLIQSQGEIGMFTDMDQATPIDQLDVVMSRFEEDADVVIGWRKERRGAPIERRIMSFGFSMLRNLILGLPFKDTQCGFKAFSRSAIEAIFPDLLAHWQRQSAKGAAVNAGFDVELLFLAKKRGLKVVEAPVSWHHVQNERQVQVISDSIQAILDMLRIRINDLKGVYN